MNRTITSREAILATCKQIVAQSGMPALNMRVVAARCGVALGSIYNYFPSKEELLVATVESIWAEIVQTGGIASGSSLTDTVSQLFESVRMGSAKYPMFLNVHAVTFAHMDKDKGRKAMNRFFGRIEALLRQSLDGDHSVRSDAFGEGFTKPAFISFVFSNILALIMDGQTTCDFLLAMIKRAICV